MIYSRMSNCIVCFSESFVAGSSWTHPARSPMWRTLMYHLSLSLVWRKTVVFLWHCYWRDISSNGHHLDHPSLIPLRPVWHNPTSNLASTSHGVKLIQKTDIFSKQYHLWHREGHYLAKNFLSAPVRTLYVGHIWRECSKLWLPFW